MHFSLRQLELRRDSCIKKMQELKASAEDKGADKIGILNFNAIGFFHGLVEMRSEDIDSFLTLFPRFPEILECARKAANEEKRRRKFEIQIEEIKIEKTKQMYRLIENEQKKERKKRKRLMMLTGATGTGEGTTKTMN